MDPSADGDTTSQSDGDLDTATHVLVSSASGLPQHLLQVRDSGDAGSLLHQSSSNRKRLQHSDLGLAVTKVEGDSDSDSQDTLGHLTYPGSGLQLGHGDTVHTLTMSNVSQSAPTLVQYAQGPDGQYFIPVSSLSGNLGYQIAPASAAGVVMTSSGPLIGGEEVSRKRELRLLKNREAARECRRKKKEYIKCLENRVALLENQNKTLIEELKSLKELYCQKDVSPSSCS